MGSIHSFCLWRLPLIFVYFSSFVAAVPWIVTEAYEREVVTQDLFYYASGSRVVTNIFEITPTATSLPPALSTITSTATSGYYDPSIDVTVIEKLYPTGVGIGAGAIDYHHNDNDDGYADGSEDHTTVFKVNFTYTAPTGCSTQWTKTTAAPVTPPWIARHLLPRTAVATSTSVDSSQPFEPTTYTYDVVFVDPTQIPVTSRGYLSDNARPTALYEGPDCNYYENGYPDGSYPYSYYYPTDNWFVDSYWMGITPLALTLILLFGWIGLWLILGFIEAFFRFRRLMTGWQTRRGLPVCWSFTILPFTLLFLCFCFKKGYRARSQADAEILQRRWSAMGFGTKLRLFFVWGFRYRYPPMLGPAPARVKTSKQPSKNPGPRLLTPSPPGSVAPETREASVAQSAPVVPHPEMAEASPDGSGQIGRAH